MKRGGKGIAGRHLLISHIDTDITCLIIAMRGTLDHFKSTSKNRKGKEKEIILRWLEKNKIGKRLGVGWGINVIGNKRHGTRETVKSESNWIFFLFLPHHSDRARGNRHAIKNLSFCLFPFPCHAAIQSILANDWKDQNLSLVLLPRGRIFLKNFMIIDFFVSLYFWTNCKAYLSSTFAELALSRTFGKKSHIRLQTGWMCQQDQRRENYCPLVAKIGSFWLPDMLNYSNSQIGRYARLALE